MGPAKGKEATLTKNPDNTLRLLSWWPDSPLWNPHSGFPTGAESAFEKQVELSWHGSVADS